MIKHSRIALLTILLLASLIAYCQEQYMGVCSVVTSGSKEITFESAGVSPKKNLVETNAIQSLFYTLFYTGLEGVNNNKPLIAKENKTYTNGFFNDQAKYTFYVVSSNPIGKIEKIGNDYRGTFQIQIRYSKLISDLKMNKVYSDVSNPTSAGTQDVAELSNVVLPTVIVVPYRQPGETFASILQNDYDKRIAVNAVQQGFEEKNITTVDLMSKLNAAERRAQYDQNADAGQSNDRRLLQTSGADIYVEVDIVKDVQPQGSRVSLTLKAYETASGNIVANQVATTQRRFQTIASDVLCAYAVQDNMTAFLEQIMKNFAPSKGTRVVLNVSIDGSSAKTMNDPAGKNGYSLSNIIRQWVRKNAYEGKYHMQGMVDDNMVFDWITIPPVDSDGLRMDAGQFAFLLESYLKETEGIQCSSRLDGNTVMITIY